MTRFQLFIIACTATLMGAAPATTALPTILQPHVYPGEIFRYDAYRTRPYTYTDIVLSASPSGITWSRTQGGSPNSESAPQYYADAGGVVKDSTGHPVRIRSFIYNSALFGKPPATLSVGARWSNTVAGFYSNDLWTVTVVKMQPAHELVHLHLVLEARGVMLPFGERWSEGDAFFLHGIMTSLSLSSNTFFDPGAPWPPMVPTNLAFEYGQADSVGYPSSVGVSYPGTTGYFETITLLTAP